MRHSLRLNPGQFACRSARFNPKGPTAYHGDFSRVSRRENPTNWRSDDTLAARIFVGFNVGDEPAYRLDDLVDLVGEIRRAQGKPNATFMSQKGIYQHHDSRHIVEEDGAQIIIIDTWSTPINDFAEEMVAMAEAIAESMSQEEVIVEIQRNGLTQEVMGVSA
jgi:hypothetical protein